MHSRSRSVKRREKQPRRSSAVENICPRGPLQDDFPNLAGSQDPSQGPLVYSQLPRLPQRNTKNITPDIHTQLEAHTPQTNCSGFRRQNGRGDTRTHRPRHRKFSSHVSRSGARCSSQETAAGRGPTVRPRNKQKRVILSQTKTKNPSTSTPTSPPSPHSPCLVSPTGSGTRIKSRRRRARRAVWRRVLLQEELLRYDEGIFSLNAYAVSGTPGKSTEATVEGELDSVVSATLKLDVMKSWSSSPTTHPTSLSSSPTPSHEEDTTNELLHAFDVISHLPVFEKLFTDTTVLHPLPGKKSSLTSSQVAFLTKSGVLAPKPYGMKVKNVVKAFTIPKASGKLRLVVDASSVGEAQTDPPHVELPSIEDLALLVAKFDWVAQLDGKSWFYQFPAAELGSYFVLRTCEGLYFLRVLAMGWSWSVWISQTTSVAINNRAKTHYLPSHLQTQVHHLAYVDNFIWVANTSAATQEAVIAFKQAAGEVGAVIKDEDHTPTQVQDILGITCDFKNKTMAIKKSWVEKFLVLSDTFFRSPGKFSLCVAWKVLGCVFWGMRVLRISQLQIPYLKSWMSRAAQGIAKEKVKWTDQCRWWTHALNDLRKVCKIIVENSPISVREKPVQLFKETIWSDASLQGGGYILENRGHEGFFQWTGKWKNLPIHVLEAESLKRAVFQWLKMKTSDEGLLINCDNVLTVLGLQKKAKGPEFCHILDQICCALRQTDWDICWVPSKEQKADTLSRRFSIS